MIIETLYKIEWNDIDCGHTLQQYFERRESAEEFKMGLIENGEDPDFIIIKELKVFAERLV